jgi:hypothetical protein
VTPCISGRQPCSSGRYGGSDIAAIFENGLQPAGGIGHPVHLVVGLSGTTTSRGLRMSTGAKALLGKRLNPQHICGIICTIRIQTRDIGVKSWQAIAHAGDNSWC